MNLEGSYSFILNCLACSVLMKNTDHNTHLRELNNHKDKLRFKNIASLSAITSYIYSVDPACSVVCDFT